jgi:beta-galactosidase
MTGEGVPMWLFDDHPEVRAKNADGGPFIHGKLVSFHNPTYLSYVEKWYQQILPIVRKNLYSQGPIILVQLCNEIGMINWIARQPDYDTSSTRNYQNFLKKRYGSIEKLNEAYGSSYANFDVIYQPNPQDSTTPASFERFLDWHRAYRTYYAIYYEKLASLVSKAKIQIPIQANIPHFYDYDTRGRGHYSPMTTTLFKEYTERVGPVIFGGAYQIRRLDYDNCQDIPMTTEVVRMISHREAPLVCAELQTGIMRDYPKLYPQDVELNLKLSTSQGLNGLNCYMLCGGDNPKGLGHFGPYHEWQAPIDSKGNFKPHAEPLREFGKWVETFGALVSQTDKVTDLALGFYAPYYETDYLSGPLHDRLLSSRNRLFYDGLVRLMHLANFSFSCLDLEKSSLQDLLKAPILCVFSLDLMDKETQSKLVQYVKKGGKLVLNPNIPLKDLSMRPCEELLTGLGLALDDIRPQRFIKMDRLEATIHSELTTFKKGNYKTFATSWDGKPCGILKKVGSGAVVVFAGGLTHEFDYHIDILKKVFELVDLKPSVKLSSPELLATLRVGKNGSFLFLFNYHDVDYSTRVQIDLPEWKNSLKFPVGSEIFIPRRSARVLPLEVPLDSKNKILYSSGEILTVRRARASIEFDLVGSGSLEWKMKTSKPKRVHLGNLPIAYQYEDGILNIHSEFPSRTSTLEIEF